MESPTENKSEPSRWRFKRPSDSELEHEWHRLQRLTKPRSAIEELDREDLCRVILNVLEQRQRASAEAGVFEAVSTGIRELLGVEISECDRNDHDDRADRLAKVGRGVMRQDGDASIFIRDLAKKLDPTRLGNIFGFFRRSRSGKGRARILTEYLESVRPKEARRRVQQIDGDQIHKILTNPKLGLRGRVAEVALATGIVTGTREQAAAQVRNTLKYKPSSRGG